MIVCIGTEKGQTSNCDPKNLPTENCISAQKHFYIKMQ